LIGAHKQVLRPHTEEHQHRLMILLMKLHQVRKSRQDNAAEHKHISYDSKKAANIITKMQHGWATYLWLIQSTFKFKQI